MRVEASTRPNNRLRLSTQWIAGTSPSSARTMQLSAAILFVAAAGSTLAIGFREPLADYLYELVIFVLAAIWCLMRPRHGMPLVPSLALTGIGIWGFSQLVFGPTVYRFATLQSSLRFAALAASAWISFRAIASRGLRFQFLRLFTWLGAIVAIVSVLAYFTSPGKILWIFEAPYPDVWGPFLSRNNFAQFLELAMPAALWLASREKSVMYLCFGAVMLAAGMASASRAGSVTLLLEALAVLWTERKSPLARRMALGFVLATGLFAAMPGVGILAGRLIEADPFQDRREIAHSALAMIAERPWTGFGLGTFAAVYPAYATFDLGQSVEHAHNDWLEWAAEGGIGFALLWAILVAWTMRPAMLTGWGVGVLGCFLHAFLDYPFARFGISAWVFIFIGMLAATDLREVRGRAH